MCAVAPGPGTARAAGAARAQSLAQRAGPDSGALVCSAQTILRQYRHPIHSSALGSCSARIQIQMQIFIYESKDNPYQGDLNTLLKAPSANIRCTSGLPKLDPFSFYVGGIGKRRGE